MKGNQAMEKTLIIAAEYRYYKMYLRANRLKERDCAFVTEVDDLLGRRVRQPVVHVLPGSAVSRNIASQARVLGNTVEERSV